MHIMSSYNNVPPPPNPTANNPTGRDFNTNPLPRFNMGNAFGAYFGNMNNVPPTMPQAQSFRFSNDNGPTPTTETTAEEATEVGGAAEGGMSIGPGLVAGALMTGLVHANNADRDIKAQMSPAFDAQHLAQLQDARDNTVAEIGSVATIGLGEVAGPVGVAVGMAGTALAESLDTVNPNVTPGTSGNMTNASQ